MAAGAFILGSQRRHLICGAPWDEWRNPETGEPLKSATTIVMAANTFAAQIHDRMPVVLGPAQFEPWLSGAAGADILKSAPEDALRMWPVSRKVNKVGNDNDPTLIDAIQ